MLSQAVGSIIGSIPKIRINNPNVANFGSKIIYYMTIKIRHLGPIILNSDWLFPRQYFPVVGPVSESVFLSHFSQQMCSMLLSSKKALIYQLFGQC